MCLWVYPFCTARSVVTSDMGIKENGSTTLQCNQTPSLGLYAYEAAKETHHPRFWQSIHTASLPTFPPANASSGLPWSTPPYSQISGNIEMTHKKSKIFCGYNNKWIDVVLSLDVKSKTVPLSVYFLSGLWSQDNENAVHKPLSDPFIEICGGVKAVLVCGGECVTLRG